MKFPPWDTDIRHFFFNFTHCLILYNFKFFTSPLEQESKQSQISKSKSPSLLARRLFPHKPTTVKEQTQSQQRLVGSFHSLSPNQGFLFLILFSLLLYSNLFCLPPFYAVISSNRIEDVSHKVKPPSPVPPSLSILLQKLHFRVSPSCSILLMKMGSPEMY